MTSCSNFTSCDRLIEILDVCIIIPYTTIIINFIRNTIFYYTPE